MVGRGEQGAVSSDAGQSVGFAERVASTREMFECVFLGGFCAERFWESKSWSGGQ